jgi:hypothetical protein
MSAMQSRPTTYEVSTKAKQIKEVQVKAANVPIDQTEQSEVQWSDRIMEPPKRRRDEQRGYVL